MPEARQLGKWLPWRPAPGPLAGQGALGEAAIRGGDRAEVARTSRPECVSPAGALTSSGPVQILKEQQAWLHMFNQLQATRDECICPFKITGVFASVRALLYCVQSGLARITSKWPGT